MTIPSLTQEDAKVTGRWQACEAEESVSLGTREA